MPPLQGAVRGGDPQGECAHPRADPTPPTVPVRPLKPLCVLFLLAVGSWYMEQIQLLATW